MPGMPAMQQNAEREKTAMLQQEQLLAAQIQTLDVAAVDPEGRAGRADRHGEPARQIPPPRGQQQQRDQGIEHSLHRQRPVAAIDIRAPGPEQRGPPIFAEMQRALIDRPEQRQGQRGA